MEDFEKTPSLPIIDASQLIRINMPPILMVGSSGSGKTYTAIDFIYGMRKKLTSLIFISNTAETRENAYLRKHVPVEIIREFDTKLLWKIWSEILRQSEFYERNTDKVRIQSFIERHCAQNPQYLQNKNQVNKLRSEFNRNLPQLLAKENFQLSTNVQQRLGVNVKESRTSSEDQAILNGFDEGFEAFAQDADMRFIADHFRPEDMKNQDDKNIVIACRSTRPCPMIVFDDVSSALEAAGRDKSDILVPRNFEGTQNTTMQKAGPAFKALLSDMLTRGRHDAKIVFCLHSFTTFQPGDRQKSGPIIISTASNLSELKNVRTRNDEDMKLINLHWPAVEKASAKAASSGKPYRYKLVYFPSVELSPANNQKLVILKVHAHEEPFELGCENFRIMLQQTLGFIKKSAEIADAPKKIVIDNF